MLLQISGAGPAGLVAAITAARAGHRVVVYERGSQVGSRFHDDFQGLENWTTEHDVLEELGSFGVDVNFDCTPFRETVIFDPFGRRYRYRAAQPIYYLVRRGPGDGTLDTGLRLQAERAGVTIRFSESSPDLPDGGIVAHGPSGSDVIAAGYVFDTDMADGAYGVIGDGLAPKGYSYLLVHAGHGTVASTIFDDFHNASRYLSKTVEFFQQHAGLTMRNERRFGGRGKCSLPHSARRGRVLFAGEAAGFQDFLWGFGMRYAMISGHLAARAFVERRPDDYDALWQGRLGGALRAGVVNRFAYAKLGDRGYAALTRRIGLAPDTRAWLRKYYAPSLLKRVLFPIAHRAVRRRASD